MLHRIRLSMQDTETNQLTGQVEVDETFIGGKARNMHKSVRAKRITGMGGKDKTIVMGMLESGGKVKAGVVKDRSAMNLQLKALKRVEPGTEIITDELPAYKGLEGAYVHT